MNDPKLENVRIMIDHRDPYTDEFYDNPKYIMIVELDEQTYRVEARSTPRFRKNHHELVAELFALMAKKIAYYYPLQATSINNKEKR